MKAIRISLFLVLFLAAGPAFAARQPAVNTVFSWLAYGDLRGNIEPCGCDPATDLGGIKRLGAMLSREKAATPTVLVFSLGNNLPYPRALGMGASSETKVPFLLEADATNLLSAALLNLTELASLPFIEDFAKIQPKVFERLPYVLSNALDQTRARKLATFSRKVEGAIVFGYTYNERLTTEVGIVDDRLIERMRKERAGEPARRSVLLFSGPDEHLETFVRSAVFDEIISSNVSPEDAKVSTSEKDDETKLTRRMSPLVRMVPLGGQGILRGGAAQTHEAKPLADYFKQSEPSKSSLGAKDLEFLKPAIVVSWLAPHQGSTSTFDDIYSRYNEAAKRRFVDAGAVRAKQLAQTPFAGAAACQGCHAEAFKVWQSSRHAHAMATLKEKNKHQDPECVTCHSVAAEGFGGFVSIDVSPQFADVQCENCHGPRLEHSKNPSKKPKLDISAREVCASCHNTQHSPSFEAKSYWLKIAHGKEAE